MKREILVQELTEAQNEYNDFYQAGCRSATVMGVLSSKIKMAEAKIVLNDAQYSWS